MDPIVPPAIDDYCAAHSSAPDKLLEELERHTRAQCANPQMIVGHLEGALLQMLVRLTSARRVLEIGTFTGYSALAMAAALPDDGALITCDVNPATSAVAQSFFDRSPHGRKITLRLGPALQTIDTLRSQPPFDLVFVDADKENYVAYYESVLPLLRRGGVIVADNVLWSGKVLAPKEKSDHALVAFNRDVRSDPRTEVVMVPIRDGVSLIRKI